MSCVVTGMTRAGSPVTVSRTDSRSSLTRSTQPCRMVGERAMPRWLRSRLPLVVSMETMASIASETSSRLHRAMSTGESMNGTGSCGRVGAQPQTWVERITSPSRTSPRACMSTSLAAAASAATAPSASETRPMRSGRAPTPPSLPRMPRVGASPPERRPPRPGTVTFTKSVLPRSPVTVRTSMVGVVGEVVAGSVASARTDRRWSASSSPLVCGRSRRSMTSSTCLSKGAPLTGAGPPSKGGRPGGTVVRDVPVAGLGGRG